MIDYAMCQDPRYKDKDYAVSFAVKPNAEGLTLIHPHRENVEWGAYFDHPP